MNKYTLLVCAGSLTFFSTLARADDGSVTRRELGSDSTEKKRGGDKGDHRQKMQERMKNATPEQKQKMKERMQQFKNASPEEREKMKQKMEKMKNASPEEREKMKQEMKQEMKQKMKNASPEDREEMKKKMFKKKGERGEKGEKGEKGGQRDAFKQSSPAEKLEKMKDPAFWDKVPEKAKKKLQDLYNKLESSSPEELESMRKEHGSRDAFRKSSPEEKFQQMQDPKF